MTKNKGGDCMPRTRSPERDKAREMYLADPSRKLKSIAEELGLQDSQIRKWKSQDKWEQDKVTLPKAKSNVTKQKPKTHKPRKPRSGNPNPVRPEGRKFETGNNAAAIHMLYSKYLHQEQIEIIELTKDMSPLDQLWTQVEIAWSALIRTQKVMTVNDKDDHTEITTKITEFGDETVVAMSHEKYESYIKAQAKAMDMYRVQLDKFIKLAPADDPRLATIANQEQKLRIEKLQLEIKKLGSEKEGADAATWKEKVMARAKARMDGEPK